MKDGENILRPYLTQCSKEEMLSEERLVSIFLEGLSNKYLHVALYMKHQKILNQCIHDAIDHDGSCGQEDKKEKKDLKSRSSAN